MDINKILLDLEVIKHINTHDKLAVILLPGETKLTVDSYSYFSGIYRKYNGYNRETTIKYIEDLLDKIQKSLITILNGNHIDIAENLKIGIKNSLDGFTNLNNSYKNDSVVSSKLNLIIKQLNSILSMLDKFSNPNEETLQEIENYTQ
jgi:hypothetical protein